MSKKHGMAPVPATPDVYLFTCCTGSAGNVGGHAVRAFFSRLAKGANAVIRLGVRSPDKAKMFFADLLTASPTSFEIVHLDFSKPNSYPRALKNATAVFIGQPDFGGLDSPALYNAFLHAAVTESSMVPLFVSFVAGIVGDLDTRPLFKMTGCRLGDSHFLAHDMLSDARDKGKIRVTFVDTSACFFQNYVCTFADLVKANHLAVPITNAPLPYIDSRDVGEFVACVMARPASYANRDFVLTGALKMSVSDWAARLSEHLRREVEHSTDPKPLRDSLRRVAVAKGVSMWDWMKPLFEAMCLVAELDLPLQPEVFEAITGKKHRGVDDFIEEFAAIDVWGADE